MNLQTLTILCFVPDGFDFENYPVDGKRLNLDQNLKFESIFSSAYALLNPGGNLVLGATYIDNDATRLKHEQAYTKMNMHVITDEADSFTATKEGFWSQRFTEDQLHRYLQFAPNTNITFIPLDTYNFARQVQIKK
jgi:hypothetical protein